jgi:hypothetical protein
MAWISPSIRVQRRTSHFFRHLARHMVWYIEHRYMSRDTNKQNLIVHHLLKAHGVTGDSGQIGSVNIRQYHFVYFLHHAGSVLCLPRHELQASHQCASLHGMNAALRRAGRNASIVSAAAERQLAQRRAPPPRISALSCRSSRRGCHSPPPPPSRRVCTQTVAAPPPPTSGRRPLRAEASAQRHAARPHHRRTGR